MKTHPATTQEIELTKELVAKTLDVDRILAIASGTVPTFMAETQPTP
jgi:hypothetical protein